jgi:signal transduction histidine kinase
LALRFDDTLDTVLAGDLRSPYGAQSAWRQIVDLIGRRRAQPDRRAMAVLRELRPHVPPAVRSASAKALEFADPPLPLVRLLALDDLPVAMPVLRSARMSAAAWIELLPELAPAARNVLRNRRDLSPAVRRALESFGSVDFVLPDGREATVDHAAPAPTSAPEGDGLPPLTLAPPAEPDNSVAPEPPAANAGQAAQFAGNGPFEIADVVARIDAFWREREEGAPRVARIAARASAFRFETDASGTVRWVDGVSRTPLIGLSLDLQGMPQGSRVDGVAAGAFRRKASFSNARMTIEGESDAAGDWLISAIPVFEPANGRFSGYRGTARRPRVDERAEPARAPVEADALRQLVHELRTPTNAIAGFAEMIEAQMLGPVSDPYRERAAIIRAQARELMGAIDDLDLAARIESAALSLAPGRVALRPLVTAIAGDLAQLSELRGSMITLPAHDLAVSGDHRAVERLLARLMATLVSASSAGERIRVQLTLEGEQMVAVTIDRPRALADYPGDSVLGIDDEEEDATLLGTGFALRLARNLARELGGTLVIAPESLTLRLPAAVNGQVGQAHLN